MIFIYFEEFNELYQEQINLTQKPFKMDLTDIDLPLLKKRRDKYKPDYKTFETDYDRSTTLNYTRSKNPQRIFQSRVYRLKTNDQEGQNQIKRQQRRLYTKPTLQDKKGEDLDEIKKDVSLLQSMLALKQSRIDLERSTKLARKDVTRHRVASQTNADQEYVPYKKLFRKRHHIQNQPRGDVQYYQIKTTPHKKLFKIRQRNRQFIEDLYSMKKPIKDDVKIRQYYRNTDHTYDSEGNLRYRKKFSQSISRLFRLDSNLKRFRKIANVILFTIRLRTYNQRIRKKRMRKFKQFTQQSLNKKLLQLKALLITFSRPFFIMLIDNDNFSYRLLEKDDLELKKQKVNSVLKLLNLQVRCIEKCVKHIVQTHQFDETFYLLCKHGNYSCIEEINTSEQMNLLCISEFFGYSRSEKYLEKASIISLFFIKLLLFNVLLQPEKIDMQVSGKVNPQIIYSNVRLLGNILYEILLDIQDQFLQKAPALYKIGNWVQLKKKFNFKIVESMTIKEGFYQKNELVSGLASHNYIQQIYKAKLIADDRHILVQMIRMLHQSIVRYHEYYRKQSFVI